MHHKKIIFVYGFLYIHTFCTCVQYMYYNYNRCLREASEWEILEWEWENQEALAAAVTYTVVAVGALARKACVAS